jgi:hypothetical protein
MKTALLILAFHSLVFAQEPSLGDVARQERARQKSITGNNKQITNESLGTAVAEPPAPETDKPADDATKPSDASADAKADVKSAAPHDEATWRAAFKEARDDVKRAEDRSKVLQLDLNKLNSDLLTRSDIFNKEGQLIPAIDAKNKELTTSEKAVEDAKQKLMQLENDLRRSGSPIGWSR